MRPYPTVSTELDCPMCFASDAVYVREQDTYFDSTDYDGFCEECNADLVIYANIGITFTVEVP